MREVIKRKVDERKTGGREFFYLIMLELWAASRACDSSRGPSLVPVTRTYGS
jgi:hypothetical protein